MSGTKQIDELIASLRAGPDVRRYAKAFAQAQGRDSRDFAAAVESGAWQIPSLLL